MSTETIKDGHFRIIGYIETKDNGDKVIKDSHFKILGYYRRKENVTQDEHFKIIAYGDCSSMLLSRI